MGPGWPAEWLVVPGWVDDKFADELAGGGVDDPDAQVLHQHQDGGPGVLVAGADVVEAAVDAQGEGSVGVDAVGADALVAVEALPGADPGLVIPLHMLCIRDMGLTLGEMFDLDALAADCAQDGVWEFLFSAPPLKVVGGVGSPLNPLAVK